MWLASTSLLVLSAGRSDLVEMGGITPGAWAPDFSSRHTYYLLLVIATSQMFTPKLSHN